MSFIIACFDTASNNAARKQHNNGIQPQICGIMLLPERKDAKHTAKPDLRLYTEK